MVYGVIFSMLASLSIAEVAKKRNKISLVNRSTIYRLVFVLICGLLIAFAGSRKNLGTDYMTYQRIFNRVINDSTLFSSKTEFFFVVLAKLTDNFDLFLLLTALVSCSIKAKVIQQISPYAFVSLLIYYSLLYISFDMGVIRQGAALSLTLWATIYIEKREPVKFAIVTFLAMLFHYTSIIFLVSYYIGTRYFSRKMLYGCSLVALALSFTNVLEIAYVPIQWMLSKLGLLKYEIYLGDAFSNSTPFEVLDLQRIIMLVFFVEFLRRYGDEESRDRNNIYINLYFISTILYYIFRNNAAINNRGLFYFRVFEIFLFPQVLKCVKSPYIREVVMLGLILYCGVYCYNVIHSVEHVANYNYSYLPYNSWLFRIQLAE